MFDDIIRDNLSPKPSKESYEERLDYLIHYINTHGVFVRHGKSLYSGMVQGLMCAKALLHETDDIETMKKKLNEIYGIETETAKTRRLISEKFKNE